MSTRFLMDPGVAALAETVVVTDGDTAEEEFGQGSCSRPEDAAAFGKSGPCKNSCVKVGAFDAFVCSATASQEDAWRTAEASALCEGGEPPLPADVLGAPVYPAEPAAGDAVLVAVADSLEHVAAAAEPIAAADNGPEHVVAGAEAVAVPVAAVPVGTAEAPYMLLLVLLRRLLLLVPLCHLLLCLLLLCLLLLCLLLLCLCST